MVYIKLYMCVHSKLVAHIYTHMLSICIYINICICIYIPNLSLVGFIVFSSVSPAQKKKNSHL